MNQCEILTVVDNYRNHPRHSASGLLGDKVSFNYVIKRIVLLICIMLDLGCDAVKQGIASDKVELAGIMGILD